MWVFLQIQLYLLQVHSIFQPVKGGPFCGLSSRGAARTVVVVVFFAVHYVPWQSRQCNWKVKGRIRITTEKSFCVYQH